MLELTTLTVFIGYLLYLRYYADQRTNAQQETDRLHDGIDLFERGNLTDALAYFDRAITGQPNASVAYLYRARIYHTLGDPAAALSDLAQGKSYDDTVSDLHLDSGRIHYEQGAYQKAFLDFDKAVFHAPASDPEPYRWRGLARQQLHEKEAGQQDMAWAVAIALAARQYDLPDTLGVSQAFFDRQLVRHMGLVALISLTILLIIKHSPVIHWPYLAAAISSVAIGFLAPRKGWVLALQQAGILWLGYLAIGASASSTQREIEAFGLYGSLGLTFVGSFLGSLIKRAQG